MRAALFICVLPLACATVSTGTSNRPSPAASFDVPEAKAQAEVIDAFKSRGLALLPTEDPHILMTLPVNLSSNRAATQEFGLSGAVTPEAATSKRTYRVSFAPDGPGTSVVVEHADDFTPASIADAPQTLADGPPPRSLDTHASLNLKFTRDSEMEASLAGDLFGVPDLEVTAGLDSPVPDAVEPLPDPSMLPTAEFQPLFTGQEPCPTLEDDMLPLIAAGHFVLLADPFGAYEPWEAIDRFACGIRRVGVPVTIAVAMPRSDQAAINAYLDSQGTAADRRALVSTPFWNRIWQDGRSDIALAMELDRIRLRRQHGSKINVLAVEPNGVTGNLRQASIASTLLQYREHNPDRLIVVMQGNVNIAKRKGTEWDADFMPFGARLATVLPDKTHAFDVSFYPGWHWTCRGAEEGTLKCGTWFAMPGPSQARKSLQTFRAFRRFDETSAQGFDGLYVLDGLTPSAPAAAGTWHDDGRSDQRPAETPYVTP